MTDDQTAARLDRAELLLDRLLDTTATLRCDVDDLLAWRCDARGDAPGTRGAGGGEPRTRGGGPGSHGTGLPENSHPDFEPVPEPRPLWREAFLAFLAAGGEAGVSSGAASAWGIAHGVTPRMVRRELGRLVRECRAEHMGTVRGEHGQPVAYYRAVRDGG